MRWLFVLLLAVLSLTALSSSSEARDPCRAAPEFGPDATVCDGGGPPGWNYLNPVWVPGLSAD